MNAFDIIRQKQEFHIKCFLSLKYADNSTASDQLAILCKSLVSQKNSLFEYISKIEKLTGSEKINHLVQNVSSFLKVHKSQIEQAYTKIVYNL